MLIAVTFAHVAVPIIAGSAAAFSKRVTADCVYCLLTILLGFIALTALPVELATGSALSGKLAAAVVVTVIWWALFYSTVHVRDIAAQFATCGVSMLVAVLAAASEEVIWRGYFTAVQTPAPGDWLAFAWLVIGFLAIHMYGISVAKFRFLLLFTAIVVACTILFGLMTAIIFHVVNNVLIDTLANKQLRGSMPVD